MAPDTAPELCWFEQIGLHDVALVGGKCASLGELRRAGVRVPPGFAVTTRAHARFMSEAGVGDDVHRLLAGLRHDDLERLEAVSDAIRAMIESAAFCAETEDAIAEHYRRLSNRCRASAVSVAVRSSATAEDLAGASFAGQHDTYLGICGTADLVRHVRRCMASLFTARAISYRIRRGVSHRDVGISVGVQQLVAASAAGVMFTVNAADGDRSVIELDASLGLGESVVSGKVTPDHFVVNKVTLDILARTIARKPTSITVDRSTRRCVEAAVAVEHQAAPSLLDGEIVELCRIARAIERHYGCAMDIEWAIDRELPAGDRIFIVQARPETVWNGRRTAARAMDGGALEVIVQTLITGHKVLTR